MFKFKVVLFIELSKEFSKLGKSGLETYGNQPDEIELKLNTTKLVLDSKALSSGKNIEIMSYLVTAQGDGVVVKISEVKE